MDEKHLNKAKGGGGGHKTGIKLYIYHPINLHGGEIRFLNFEQLNPIGIMANTNLTNQGQVFVEEYVRSGDNH
jgi:hypothetical protein